MFYFAACDGGVDCHVKSVFMSKMLFFELREETNTCLDLQSVPLYRQRINKRYITSAIIYPKPSFRRKPESMKIMLDSGSGPE
jgi:hypothetical protein